MTRFAGLDASVRETSVCVVDEGGKVLAERKVATEPDDLIELLRSISREYGRIGLEAGPLSQWLVNSLAEAGRRLKVLGSRAAEERTSGGWPSSGANWSGEDAAGGSLSLSRRCPGGGESANALLSDRHPKTLLQ